MTQLMLQQPSRLSILPRPHSHRFAAARELSSLVEEQHRLRASLVAVHDMPLLPAADVPSSYGLVDATAGERQSVRRERDRANNIVVTPQRAAQFIVGDAPQANGAVVAAGSQQTSVGRILHSVDVACVMRDASFAFARCRIPDANRPIAAGAR